MPNICRLGTKECLKPFIISEQEPKLFSISASALNRVIKHGSDYAFANAPKSPNPKLTSNKYPEESNLNWLKNKNKCNQFVGDVLTQSGYAMPTFKMQDKSEHYKNAELLPKETQYFSKVTADERIQSGDVFVKDYSASNGESGAHTEIVIAADSKNKKLTLAGAHRNGASISEINFDPKKLSYDPIERSWSNGTDKIYILRPKKKIKTSF